MTTSSIPSDWSAGDISDQSGRTAIVTGANSGLGLITARELARHGAHVIMAVRNPDRGAAAAAAISSIVPRAHLEVRRLDLSDLHSVQAFSSQVDRVDLLVNNAGVMMPPRSLTAQGFELQFGSNHLGHFALTGRLLPVLLKADAPRVVTVSSTLHKRGRINFDDLDFEHGYSPTVAYRQSKFANVLFGLELDRRARAAGTSLASILAHPGYSATNLQTSGPTGATKLAGRIGNALIAQNAEIGALPQLYAATSPAAISGQFIGPRHLNEMRGAPTLVKPAPSATDPSLAARLWQVSESRTGVRYDWA